MLGTAIDVVIGLIFIYLLLSLVVSALNELIAHALSLRANTLEQGIARMLQHEEIKDAVYQHPLLKGMSTDTIKPSYIPSGLFSMALLDVVSAHSKKPEVAEAKAETNPETKVDSEARQQPWFGANQGDPEGARKSGIEGLRAAIAGLPEGNGLRRALQALIEDSRSVAEARKRVADWYDDTMERVSGWYKRKSQLWIVGIGAMLTFGANIDTIRIARALSHDAALRASLVAAADHTVSTGEPKSDKGPVDVLTEVAGEFISFNLPVGWTPDELREAERPGERRLLSDRPFRTDLLTFFFVKLIGLLLTTISVTQGAPFWFDLLNRVVNIRSAGKPPALAADDDQK